MWENIKVREDVVSKLYTGITTVKVDLVNPSREELAEYLNRDIESINEPSYDGRIDIRVSNDLFKSKITFWPKDEIVETKDGTKKMYLDHFGRTAWVENEEDLKDMEYFDTDKPYRVARKGEADIYAFFIGWINPDLKEGELVLPYDDFIKGDVSVIKSAIEHFSDREVRCLAGVQQNKYQVISERVFTSANSRYTKSFENTLKNWRNTVSSIDFQEYTAPKVSDAMLESEGETTGDDLPF